MDLDTAVKLLCRIRKEQNAFSNNLATAVPFTRQLMDMEVARLYKDIDSKSRRFIEEGGDIKIAVDNQLMMFNLSNEFGLGDISSLEDFKGKLNAELERIDNFRIDNFHYPLPLTSQFIGRVIEHLDEELLARESAGHEIRSEAQTRVRPWQEFVNICINDEIDSVLRIYPSDASSELVISRLEQNPSIQIDDSVRSDVRQKYFEATFPLDRQPAQGDHSQGSRQ